ncbi:MAG: LON peptidase substrate-binding domain-containing protein [Acidobacteria bacterium]|nr:LON peptidase substrate-binding domain-containing protein [Acidobacteriota bacterium]
MKPESLVIPLFPLDLVQFPGAITPLHIFEPRYRQMLKDVMAGDKSFGIIFRDSLTLIDSENLPEGSIGCLIEVAVAQGMADGRSNILCLGKERFRLLGYVEGEPYLKAEVELFDDDLDIVDPSDLADKTRALFLRLMAAGRKLKNQIETDDESPELPDDAQSLSLIIPAYLEIDNSEKQYMLELTSTVERLDYLNSILENLARDYENRAITNQFAKSNGHGGKLPKM